MGSEKPFHLCEALGGHRTQSRKRGRREDQLWAHKDCSRMALWEGEAWSTGVTHGLMGRRRGQNTRGGWAPRSFLAHIPVQGTSCAPGSHSASDHFGVRECTDPGVCQGQEVALVMKKTYEAEINILAPGPAP